MYYSLEILSQPKIEHAVFTTEHMNSLSLNIIDHRKNIIELGWCSGADLFIESGATRAKRKSETLRIYFPDEKYILRPMLADSEDSVRICDIAVRIDEMKLERIAAKSDAELVEWLEKLSSETILLSDAPDIPEEDVESVVHLMQSIVNCRLDRSAAGRLKCLSLWYETIALLDFSIRSQIYSRFEQVRKVPSSAYYHVYRIKKYISAHLSEKLSVNIIANAIALSPDYVGRIFRNECGMSIPTYITQKRVEYIRRLIESHPDESLSNIAAAADFSDLRYSQRVFKQYTGITMFRCRQLGNGLTLWHNNPWKQQNLEEDIFVSSEENSDEQLQ